MEDRKDVAEHSAAPTCYVLVFIGTDGKEWQYFKSQNLYLGQAMLTDTVEDAAKLTLDDAEAKWDCMTVKDDWAIWSVRPGIVLDKPSDRHVVRAKRKALEQQLASLPECT